MKYAHFVEMRVFCKENEDENAIRAKINELFPFEKKNIESKIAFGFEEKKIIILTVHLKKDSQINKFLKEFMTKISTEDRNTLLRQLESRLDNSLHFFIRLEKDDLMTGFYTLTDSGNCFHFKISIATYPHDRELAKTIVKKIVNMEI